MVGVRTEVRDSSALPVLPAGEAQAVFSQVLLVAGAIVLPALAHVLALPTRALLPMHWPILLAGLVYGWRAGVFVGLAAPVFSFLFSGAPHAAVLPAMTLEMVAYGVVAGAVREGLRWGPALAVLLAVAAGRLVFAAVWLLGSGAPGGFGDLASAFLPGVPAALTQLAILPPVARLWIRRGGG